MSSTGEVQTSQGYIQHHLTNLTVGDGFWTWHIDSLFFSVGLGCFVSCGCSASVAKKATTGVPRQAAMLC